MTEDCPENTSQIHMWRDYLKVETARAGRAIPLSLKSVRSLISKGYTRYGE